MLTAPANLLVAVEELVQVIEELLVSPPVPHPYRAMLRPDIPASTAVLSATIQAKPE